MFTCLRSAWRLPRLIPVLISLRILFQSLSLWKKSFQIMHLVCDSMHLAALTLFCKSSYTHFHVLFQHKYVVFFILIGSPWQSSKIEVCLGSLSYCCVWILIHKPEGGESLKNEQLQSSQNEPRFKHFLHVSLCSTLLSSPSVTATNLDLPPWFFYFKMLICNNPLTAFSRLV